MPDDPFQISPNFVNPSYVTPQQLLQMRMVAQQLMGPDQQQVMRPAQGWSNLANTLVGTLMNNQANQGQRQMLQQGQNAMTGAAQQNPYAAMLLGGGVPQAQQQPQMMPQVQGQGGATSAPGQSPPMQSAGVPRGIRNNNPGNIEDGPFAKSVPGYAGSDGRFAIFQTPQAGQMAMDKLLSSYGQRGLNTPQAIASRWAPAGDGGNNPMAYASTVAGQMGVQPNTQLNMSDPNVRAQLAAGMTQMENGRQMPQQPNMQMAQNAPQGGQAAMAHMYMDPNVPEGFKTAVQGGQVPQMISDAAGNTYLYKPGMTQPVLVPGLKQAGAPIDIGPAGTKIGLGTLGSLGGTQGAQGGLNALNPLMQYTQQQAAEAERQKTQASEGAKAAMVPIGEAMKEVKTAPQALNAVNVIEDVAKNYGDKITTGPFANQILQVKQAVNGLIGSDVMGSTAPAEIIKKMNAQLASAALPAFTNRGTQFDLKVFMDNNPGLNNSIQGTLFLTNILKQVYRQNMQIGQLASDQRNWGNWAQVQSDFYKNHPLVNPITNTPLGVKADTEKQSSGLITRWERGPDGRPRPVQ